VKASPVILFCLVLSFSAFMGSIGSQVEAGSAIGHQSSFTIGSNHSAIQTSPISDLGSLLTWSYSTTGNVEFSLNGPDGLKDYNYPGTEGSTYSNWAWINTSGNYSFNWTSHDLSPSVTVYYSVMNFKPTNASLLSPQTGIIQNERNITASGTMDEYASKFAYSLDNITYYNIASGLTPGTWSIDLKLSSGNNILYLATTYGEGNTSFTYYQPFSIVAGFGLDFVPDLQITYPNDNITELVTTLYGTCDANASSVYVSLDNVTFFNATKFSSIWHNNLTLESGLNTIYIREDFQRGNFSYQYYTHSTINVDTVTQSKINESIQIGTILIISVLVMLSVVGYFLFKNKK
jgi:hypothetical protein